MSTGDWSTGYWSTGDRSTGYFSTIDDMGLSIFNKPISYNELKKISFPSFLYFNLTEWITSENMSDCEKEEHPDYTVLGGYLKVFDYKEAFQNAYNNAPKEEIEQLKALPHFDAEIFYNISGIDVTADVVKEMTLEDICKELGREIKIIK